MEWEVKVNVSWKEIFRDLVCELEFLSENWNFFSFSAAFQKGLSAALSPCTQTAKDKSLLALLVKRQRQRTQISDSQCRTFFPSSSVSEIRKWNEQELSSWKIWKKNLLVKLKRTFYIWESYWGNVPNQTWGTVCTAVGGAEVGAGECKTNILLQVCEVQQMWSLEGHKLPGMASKRAKLMCGCGP